jgi:integrase
MATFKTVVQKQRPDGYWLVYIRVTHNRKVAFIRTDKFVKSSGLERGTKNVKDPYVLRQTTQRITGWLEQLNKYDTHLWSVQDIVEFCRKGEEDVSFSQYARKHHDRMYNNGQERNARNYELAYQHLERFAGTTDVKFSQLTSTFVNQWIESLAGTKRAKEMYPVCVRQIFKEACKELNDYDTGLIRIKTNPWVKVEIPHADRPEKLAITPEECRAFFSAPIPESKLKSPLTEFGRDVAFLVFCLAGINTVDLYELKKSDYYDGVIHYHRAKTKKFRADGAYMEMRVPGIAQATFDKYLNHGKSDYLFNFHERLTSSDSFSANVNIGIRRLCASMGIPKERDYCVYTFRHTWGTIAQNDCGASISDVAFAMNHASGHKVTRGYIKLDFTPAWELNEKVLDLVFFTERPSNRERLATTQPRQFERFSKLQMMKSEVYFRGKLLGELTDTGFSSVDDVINALQKFVPATIPPRCMLLYKIENMDKHQTQVYTRMVR